MYKVPRYIPNGKHYYKAQRSIRGFNILIHLIQTAFYDRNGKDCAP